MPRAISRFSLLVIALGLVAVISGLAVIFSRSLRTGVGQDFTTFYAAAWGLRHGFDPYGAAPVLYAARHHLMHTGGNQPPLIVLSITPWLLFSPHTALVLFTATQYALVAIGGGFLAALAPRPWRPALVAAMVGSPATFVLGLYGQTTAAVFVLAAVGLWSRIGRRWLLLGVCVGTSLWLKPQLCPCTVLPLLWGAPRAAWKAGVVAGTAVFGLMLVTPGPSSLSRYAHQLVAFSRSGNVTLNGEGLDISSLYRSWLQSSIVPWLTAGLKLGLLLALGLLLLRWRWRPSLAALAAAALLLTLLLPYSHQYDAVALFPAMLLTAVAVAWTRPEACCLGLAFTLMAISPLMAVSAFYFPFRLFPAGLLLCLVVLARNGVFQGPCGADERGGMSV